MIETRKLVVVLILAFVGWALCAAIIGIGMAVTSELNALIAHAIGAPIVFALISFFFFKKLHYMTPFHTAVIFVGFVILTDFFVVAIIIMRNLEMFSSVVGTWIPFVLIFLSTYLTGLYIAKNTR